MKKNNKVINFLKRKDVLATLSFSLVALLALTGIVVVQERNKVKTREENLVDLNEVAEVDDIILETSMAEEENVDGIASLPENEKNEVNSNEVLTQEELDEILSANNDMDIPEGFAQDEDEVVDAASGQVISTALDFTDADMLSWPIQGNVILDYSMDKSVYFSTLDQYKYNPALIISAEVNEQVVAAALGVVESIEVSEETGTTVVTDLGNGFKAVYGQLKEVPVSVGDTVEEGAVLGYVSDPTRYYSVEGSNLYFKLMKDEDPVDPMTFLP